jgi:uncharacterized ubiquitin-like protein YukD
MEKKMIKKLIDIATEQLKFSYAPYSNFIKTGNGHPIFQVPISSN